MILSLYSFIAIIAALIVNKIFYGVIKFPELLFGWGFAFVNVFFEMLIISQKNSRVVKPVMLKSIKVIVFLSLFFWLLYSRFFNNNQIILAFFVSYSIFLVYSVLSLRRK